MTGKPKLGSFARKWLASQILVNIHIAQTADWDKLNMSTKVGNSDLFLLWIIWMSWALTLSVLALQHCHPQRRIRPSQKVASTDSCLLCFLVKSRHGFTSLWWGSKEDQLYCSSLHLRETRSFSHSPAINLYVLMKTVVNTESFTHNYIRYHCLRTRGRWNN